jgi:hypothetical protein
MIFHACAFPSGQCETIFHAWFYISFVDFYECCIGYIQLLCETKKKFQLHSFTFQWALQLFGTWCASIWGCLKKLKVEFENSECLKHILWPLNDLKHIICQVQHFRSRRPLEFWYKVSCSNFIWFFCTTPISKDDLNYQPHLKINF